MSKETKALKDLKRAYDKALEQSRQHEMGEIHYQYERDMLQKRINEALLRIGYTCFDQVNSTEKLFKYLGELKCILKGDDKE